MLEKFSTEKLYDNSRIFPLNDAPTNKTLNALTKINYLFEKVSTFSKKMN